MFFTKDEINIDGKSDVVKVTVDMAGMKTTSEAEVTADSVKICIEFPLIEMLKLLPTA